MTEMRIKLFLALAALHTVLVAGEKAVRPATVTYPLFCECVCSDAEEVVRKTVQVTLNDM